MNTITIEEIKALKEVFPFETHEIRQGTANRDKTKCQWFVYIERGDIADRLDNIFGGDWEFFLEPVVDRGTHYSVIATLRIRGITRQFNGTAEKGDFSPDNDEKGVATDAFRRVASMWGIGAYLWGTPPLWTAKPNDYKEESTAKKEAFSLFEKYYNSISNGRSKVQSRQAQSVQKQTDDNKPQPGQKQGKGDNHDNKWHGNFVEWCGQDNVMGNASIKEIVEAMNNSLVTRVKLPEIADYTIAHLGMMPHDKEHATAAIIAWKAGYDADNIDVAIESVFNMDNKSEEDRERIHNLYNQSVRFAIANANRHFGEVEF